MHDTGSWQPKRGSFGSASFGRKAALTFSENSRVFCDVDFVCWGDISALINFDSSELLDLCLCSFGIVRVSVWTSIISDFGAGRKDGLAGRAVVLGTVR